MINKLKIPHTGNVAIRLDNLGIPILREDRAYYRYVEEEIGNFFVITNFSAKELKKKIGLRGRIFGHDSPIKSKRKTYGYEHGPKIEIEDLMIEENLKGIYYHHGVFFSERWLCYNTYVLPVNNVKLIKKIDEDFYPKYSPQPSIMQMYGPQPTYLL